MFFLFGGCLRELGHGSANSIPPPHFRSSLRYLEKGNYAIYFYSGVPFSRLVQGWFSIGFKLDFLLVVGVHFAAATGTA